MYLYPHLALMVAGAIFGFVALMHLLRLIYKVPIRISNKTVPLWVSGLAFLLALFLSLWVTNAHCSPALGFQLKSAVLADGDFIPAKYTCIGDNVSIPLAWHGEPSTTKSYVLIVNDPDAPGGNWIHWIVFNVPASTHEMVENLLSKDAHFGKNSFGKSAYGGPCPPKGKHRYIFKLYALDSMLNLPEGSLPEKIKDAMQGHILATASLMGYFSK